MNKEYYCIIACGGHGTRMKSDLPKQFLRLADKTILQLTLEKLENAIRGMKFILVLPREYTEYWRNECDKSSILVNHMIVQGGITRFHSVKNALEKVPENAIVGVHDAVRPFVGPELVRRLYEEAEISRAAVPVVPVTDTVKVLDTQLCEIEGANVDRSVLYGAQTPQVFDAAILKEAYSQPYMQNFTDDASVVRAAGFPVKYIPGEKYNLKITTPEDLTIAAMIAAPAGGRLG